MSKLRVPLSAIPDSGYRVSTLVERSDIRPEGAEDLSVRNIQFQGTLYEAGDDYLFSGIVAGTFEDICGRCLDAVSVPLDVAVHWTFRRNVPEETLEQTLDSESLTDEEFLFGFDGNEIDLGSRVWEELVLLAPAKYLCRADCAGLCPHCGANLNRDTCACPKEESMGNSGLAELGRIFSDLKRQPPKE